MAAILNEISMVDKKSPQMQDRLSLEEIFSETLQALQRDIQSLSATNHAIRRKSLEKIDREILSSTPPFSEDVLQLIFQHLHKSTLKLFSDTIDRTRETAIKLVVKFCCQVTNSSEFLPSIIPTICQRISSDENAESTEELRLLLIESLSRLVDLNAEEIGVYMDDLVLVLRRAIEDPFAEVRKASCSCACKLTITSPERFYQQGESLVPPLLKCFSHQHNKVRAAALQTIGVVVLSTSGKCVDDVYTHLAQRTFDRSAPVRSMVVDVVGKWLVELRDRYSFFAKLIPILLSGLCDEMKDIRVKTNEYFKKAGVQFEEENESDFKEKNEYEIIKKFQHRITYERPCLGCRVLVQRNFSKILPAIVHDMTDWTPDTRIKSSALLYHLVIHCEDHITMSMQLLSQGLCQAAHDEERDVVIQSIRTAELVGMFVEPAVYCQILLPHLRSVSTSSPKHIASGLCILAAYMRGSSDNLLQEQTALICKCLEDIEVSSSIDGGIQEQLQACIQALVNKNVVDEVVGCKLFQMLLNISALSKDEANKSKVCDGMKALSGALRLDDYHSLFRIYGGEILDTLNVSCDQWSSQSSDCFTFVSLLSLAGPSLVHLLDNALPIFIQCTDAEKDSEMRQKLFTMMSQLVMTSSQDSETVEKFKEHSTDIVERSILPNCVWKAGRVAAVIRSVAMSFLWALLEAGIVSSKTLKTFSKDITTQILSCLDDHNDTTRLVTVKVLLKLLKVCKGDLHVDELHKIYPELLKRMDDISDVTRIVTTKAMSAYFACLPVEYDAELFRSHLQYIFKNLLIHLDDRNEDVQRAVLSALKDGAKFGAVLLKSLVIEVKLKHRTRQFCEELVVHCENL